MAAEKLRLDEIGFWSEIKLEIIKRYADAYSKILSKVSDAQTQRGYKITHYYIDAFAGAGTHRSKSRDELIRGSPGNALLVQPHFKGYFFIDSNKLKVNELRRLAGERKDVKIFEGDCNTILIDDIFPQVQYAQFRRALCFLDPYGLHLDWEVVYRAGQMKSIEIFLNFPIMDMNMNVLKHKIEAVDEKQISRMNAFWGDRSWENAVYDRNLDMFGYPIKGGNEEIVRAYQKRLKEVVGFKYVPDPLPLRNRANAVVYYLFYASHNATGNRIANHIFSMFRDKTK